jgi:hypothetical protein
MLAKIFRPIFCLGAMLCVACAGADWHAERVSRRLDAMSVHGVPNWEAVREVLIDCRDRTYRYGYGVRRTAFAVVTDDAPADVRALIIQLAKLPVAETEPEAVLDATAVGASLRWLSIHKDPTVAPLAFQRLDDQDLWVLSAALGALEYSQHWSATAKVEEVLNRLPQDAATLVTNVKGLEFLAASPAAGPEVCGLRRRDLDAYCRGVGRVDVIECSWFKSAWSELDRRFGCARPPS